MEQQKTESFCKNISSVPISVNVSRQRMSLKILAITKADIADVSEHRRSVLPNCSGAKSKTPFFQHLRTGNTYTPIHKARATRIRQKSPSFCALSYSMVSIIKFHFLLKLHTQGRHFLLLHSDNKWLKAATEAPPSPITGSFKRLRICRTAQLGTSCSMLARSCLKA